VVEAVVVEVEAAAAATAAAAITFVAEGLTPNLCFPTGLGSVRRQDGALGHFGRFAAGNRHRTGEQIK